MVLAEQQADIQGSQVGREPIISTVMEQEQVDTPMKTASLIITLMCLAAMTKTIPATCSNTIEGQLVIQTTKNTA